MNAKENTLKLLSLLLLTELLALSSAEAFLGWGKYPSKMDALEACYKWIDNGPTKTISRNVPLSDEVKTIMLKAAIDEFEKRQIERARRKMDVEVPIRKCQYEGTTRQFIGIDENSKKYFRY